LPNISRVIINEEIVIPPSVRITQLGHPAESLIERVTFSGGVPFLNTRLGGGT
jgi:hypothetical protein